ncbi:MAG: HNH endonuclease [Bacilli bacterium]
MGKCAILKIILEYDEIHCHHKIPKQLGGTDKYNNLIIIHKDIHILIHSKSKKIIDHYLEIYNLNSEQINKVNTLRTQANLEPL